MFNLNNKTVFLERLSRRSRSRREQPMLLRAMDGRLKKLLSRRAGLVVMLCFTAAILLMLFQSTRAGGLLRLVLQYSSPTRMSPLVVPFFIEVVVRTFFFFLGYV